MKITIELCTAGPHYKPVAAHAKKIGLAVSPNRFVRQQDIRHNGVEVFPRVWNKGKPDEAVMNGGEPGRHDTDALHDGCLALGRTLGAPFHIADIEPENWHAWFKGDAADAVDLRRIAAMWPSDGECAVEALSVLRSAMPDAE